MNRSFGPLGGDRRRARAIIALAAGLLAHMPAVAVDRDTVDLSNGGGLVAFRTDNVLNIGTLSLDRSFILLFGCIGETCSGFVPFPQFSTTFTLNVRGTASLNEASFLVEVTNLPANVPSIDVRFDGPTVLSGNTAFGGAYDASVGPQGLVNYTNASDMVQRRGGSTTLANAFFYNKGTYVLQGDGTFAVSGVGGTTPPNAPLPKFGFVNDGILKVEPQPATPGSPGSPPTAFVEYLYNNGKVLVEGSAPAMLEIGGGRHRNGQFESTTPAPGGIAYSGSHEFTGNTIFRGDHRLLSRGLTGTGAAQFDFGYRAETTVDGTMNIDEGAVFALSGTDSSNVSADAGATLTVLPNASVTIGAGGTLAARKGSQVHVASGGHLGIDGTFGVDETIHTRPSPPPSLLNDGEVRVTGSVTGTGEIVSNGTMRVDAGATMQAKSLESSGILEVNGTIETTGGQVTVLGGVLQGSGIINGDLNVQRGAISSPVVFPGNSAGTLTVNGAFRLEAGAELVLEIERLPGGGVAFDRIDADTTFIDGLVRLSFGAGIDPLRDRFLVASLPFFNCRSDFGLPTCDFGDNYRAVVDGYPYSSILTDPFGNLLITDLGPPIPEPQSWVLMALGLGALASRRAGRRPLARMANTRVLPAPRMQQ